MNCRECPAHQWGLFGAHAVFVVLAGASYFALLAWAVVSGQGIGGPLAFHFMVLLALLVMFACVIGVLFPVTVAAELVRSRLLHWHRLAEIPLSATLLLAYIVGLAVAIGVAAAGDAGLGARYGVLASMALAIPLGLYWCCLQSTDFFMDLVRRLFQ